MRRKDQPMRQNVVPIEKIPTTEQLAAMWLDAKRLEAVDDGMSRQRYHWPTACASRMRNQKWRWT